VSGSVTASGFITSSGGLQTATGTNIIFPETSTTSYANIFRQSSTAALVLANGYKFSATAGGFASSFVTSARTAIQVGGGTISFFSDPSSTVAVGTDIAATERLRLTSAGRILMNTTTDNGVDQLQVSGSGLVTGNFVAASSSGNVSLRNTASTYPVNITTGATSGIGMYQDGGTAVIIGTNAAVTAMSPISIRGTTVDLDNNLKVNAAGRVLIGNPTPNDITGEAVQVNGAIICDQFKIWGLNTAPASASATGTLGEIRIDANYIYICTATNTWKRVAIATW
jgi:hypothetical protein